MSVLVATKVKNAAIWLPRFIDQVEELEGNIEKIVVIYGQSSDSSLSLLKQWRAVSKHKVEIYNEPYLPETERSGATLARLKRDIQALLKASSAKYYLNLDCDLTVMPKDLIPRLMAHDKDIVAAMVWTEGRDEKTFFDTFEFRLDGCMFHPYNPPGVKAEVPFTVDSMSTCYLAKKEVELAGVYKNPYPHIPFCKDLKDKGFQIWVDPKTHVYHVDLEALGIMHQPMDHPYAHVPFIKDSGEKVGLQEPTGQRFLIGLQKYEAQWTAKRQEDATRVADFMESRPLITASIKVLNEAEFIEPCLKSIYPYVDKIDIVYGPVTHANHIEQFDGTPGIIAAFPDPQKKITFIPGRWQTKEQIQQKLLEICQSKWMLFIDADEVIKPEGGIALRAFCQANQQGEAVYARPKQFFHFIHDFQHTAFSNNPLSPWGQFGQPHAFLIWRDLVGLNFNGFHTVALDLFGEGVSVDNPRYAGRQKIIDELVVYHFGNAKSQGRMLDKIVFERRRDHNPSPPQQDWWFTGEMPADFMVASFNEEDLPEVMKAHPEFGKTKLEVVQEKPTFKFKVLENASDNPQRVQDQD